MTSCESVSDISYQARRTYCSVRPSIFTHLPWLRGIEAYLSAVWEEVSVEESRGANARRVGMNQRGQLVELCFRRKSDDLWVNLFILTELLEKATNLQCITVYIDNSMPVMNRILSLDMQQYKKLTDRMRSENWKERILYRLGVHWLSEYTSPSLNMEREARRNDIA